MASEPKPVFPSIGAGCALIEGDSILLIERGNEPAKGKWTVPGGMVEPGETLREACRREMKEETGLDVELGPLIGVYDLIEKDSKGELVFHYVVADFLAVSRSGEPRAGDDAADFRWQPLDRLSELPLTRNTAEMAATAYEILSMIRGECGGGENPID